VHLARGEAADLASPGASVTLLQLSTEVCAPCKATHAVLERVAGDRGIAHVDLDITHRPEVAQRFRVLTTPTTLVLDASGAVRARITGAAKAADVIRTLDRLSGAAA
jgi:thioredoxin-like negative regulator of GroEL